MWRTITSSFLIITGFLACPCHLALTLPLLLALFGGTAFGTFLAAHTGWVVALSTGYFLAAIGFGFWRLSTPRRSACSTPRTARSAAEQRLYE
ncbi:MAG: hypothetical protein M3R24_14940 [Chloroflexota bacterium]|nr:hypothetical protein [Chloroflexota bacterium]PLS77567.1 MAG: hypothetical protein CYG59_23210 [Chloroflexota bacterium]